MCSCSHEDEATVHPINGFQKSAKSFHNVQGHLISAIKDGIASVDKELRDISLFMSENPEIAYEEVQAAARLTSFMESKGFVVRREICGLKTAWSAEFEHGSGGPTIGFNSEMDALPGLGHGCGHNLIAISGAAAAVGVASALKFHNIPGRILLLGTPAEEKGGGKVPLLEGGAYDSMDACLMLHPMGRSVGAGTLSVNAKQQIVAEFFGKPAHGAAAPHLGVNALDAATLSYVNINTLRPSLIPEVRLMGILKGAETWVENIIPEYAAVTYGVRAPTSQLLDPLVKRIENCFKAAALATGCELKISYEERYDDLQNSQTMGDYFHELISETWGHGGKDVVHTTTTGSTDFGNVTYRLPGLHPAFGLPDIDPNEHPHSTNYASGAKTESAHKATLRAAAAIATVGIRILVDEPFRLATRSSWEEQMTALGVPFASKK
ncbi:hypothetical protein T439DRAFT_284367 [Meredithblackwellia eburnea MCA 4105]